MEDSKKIYIIEDEKETSRIVVMYLEKEGFEVVPFYRGDNAMEAIINEPPDLIVLDIMLPGMDGLQILQKIRRESFIPVIMLTARDDEIDRILGLEMGADDYVPKPFSPRELAARVKSLLRRVQNANLPNNDESSLGINVLKTHSFVLDLDSRMLSYKEKSTRLTNIEFTLLKCFMKRPGKVFARSELLSIVWGDELEGATRTVDMHMKNLRKKIKEISGFEHFIQSMRGVGYVFED